MNYTGWMKSQRVQFAIDVLTISTGIGVGVAWVVVLVGAALWVVS
jgi:hypothetical protein